MAPRNIVSRVAQRAASGLAVAALALGVFGGVAPVSTALAAPANAGSPDLIAGDLMFRGLKPGERAEIGVLVANKGTATAQSVQVKIETGVGLQNVSVSGSGWSCSERPGEAFTLSTVFLCSTPSIEADAGLGLLLTATKADDGTAEFAWVKYTADPNNKVRESNESNNQTTSQF
jgi:subtilase family serine protease